MAPLLSVVVLTLNEERNIGACLASLARQASQGFEVVVVDAASSDRTVAILREMQATFPVPLRIEAATRRLPIGEARNLGVSLCAAPIVAFLSADAELEGPWIAQALQSLRSSDIVFGRQLHAPHQWTVGAAVRGLRYQFPLSHPSDPLRYASNVAAAYRKGILLAYPFDPWANAAEDLLLARRAVKAGYRAAYNPEMAVRHHDVRAARDEMRKNVREGHGCGVYVDELGAQWSVLAWAAAFAMAIALLAVRPALGIPLLVAVVWAPPFRRALRRRHAMPIKTLLVGVAASPAFDLLFTATYLWGLLEGRNGRSAPPRPLETKG
jgi:glycosyltransferase involved in cell wall biosynthesis